MLLYTNVFSTRKTLLLSHADCKYNLCSRQYANLKCLQLEMPPPQKKVTVMFYPNRNKNTQLKKKNPSLEIKESSIRY